MATTKEVKNQDIYQCDNCKAQMTLNIAPKFDSPLSKGEGEVPDGFCSPCLQDWFRSRVVAMDKKKEEIREGLRLFYEEMEKMIESMDRAITAQQAAGNGQRAAELQGKLGQVRLLHTSFVKNAPWLKAL